MPLRRAGLCRYDHKSGPKTAERRSDTNKRPRRMINPTTEGASVLTIVL